MVGVLDSNKNNKKLDLNNANHDSEEDLIWFLYEKMNTKNPRSNAFENKWEKRPKLVFFFNQLNQKRFLIGWARFLTIFIALSVLFKGQLSSWWR